MRLGTRLTIYLALIIILVLSGYGYLHIISRRNMYVRKMKVEVKSIGQTLKIALEKIPLHREGGYVQELIDAMEEYERTRGVLVYQKRKELLICSHSLTKGEGYFLQLIKDSMSKDEPQEVFQLYEGIPVFVYSFPLKNESGKTIGGVAIIQNTSFMEEEISAAKRTIFFTILILIGGTVSFVLFVARRWIAQPISRLMEGVKKMAQGQLETRIDLKKGDEIYELAQAFNQMAADLKKAQNRIMEEGEKRLESERSLQQSQKLAIIGQFASGLAHEIGTPLNIISGRAELIKVKLDDKEGIAKNLGIILQQTERIKAIIQQLLNFMRKKKPEQILMNIPTLIENSLVLLAHEIEKQGISVVKEFPHDSPVVRGDPTQLQQVLINIFLNALQAMPNGGQLRIFYSLEKVSREEFGGRKEYIVIGVADSGMGMEQEVLNNIFNPFFTTKASGTGLGLMVVKGIVQEHEGWIEVESEVGKGSTFKIYLPQAEIFEKEE